MEACRVMRALAHRGKDPATRDTIAVEGGPVRASGERFTAQIVDLLYAASKRGPQVGQTTEIILCRHGESEGNLARRFGGHGPTPLTERGRAQARAAARVLAGTGVDVLYSSDLPRAMQTAAPIAEAAGVPVQLTPALRERSVGDLTGLTFDEARARFPDAFAAMLRREPEACPPGGESYVQCRARAAAFFENAVIQHAGARIVLVSHHLTLHQLISHVLGVQHQPVAQRAIFQVDNCALHRFERLEDGTFRVVALNERAHLDGV